MLEFTRILDFGSHVQEEGGSHNYLFFELLMITSVYASFRREMLAIQFLV